MQLQDAQFPVRITLEIRMEFILLHYLRQPQLIACELRDWLPVLWAPLFASGRNTSKVRPTHKQAKIQ